MVGLIIVASGIDNVVTGSSQISLSRLSRLPLGDSNVACLSCSTSPWLELIIAVSALSCESVQVGWPDMTILDVSELHHILPSYLSFRDYVSIVSNIYPGRGML